MYMNNATWMEFDPIIHIKGVKMSFTIKNTYTNRGIERISFVLIILLLV